VRFCHFAAPETGDASETVLQTVLAAAAFAILIANTVQAIRIADLRYEIAKGYADIARDRWDRFSSKFKPLEARVAGMLMDDPEVEPEYEEARRAHAECAGDAGWESRWLRTARRYGLCPDPSLGAAVLVDQGLRADDLVNLGYRDAEDVAALRDVDRWDRRLRFLNTGRDLASMSLEAARAGDAILENGQQQAGKGINAALGFLSYVREARDTVYSGLGIMPISLDGSGKDIGNYHA
jgi:hypothetical protein